jgi:hypothetical protein
MAEIIQFPKQDTSVAYIARDTRTAVDRPDEGQHIIECETVGVLPETPFSFRAYDLPLDHALKLLAFYNDLTATH